MSELWHKFDTDDEATWPPSPGNYLVTDGFKVKCLEWYRRYEGDWAWLNNVTALVVHRGIHSWMPLPDPPKKGNGDE